MRTGLLHFTQNLPQQDGERSGANECVNVCDIGFMLRVDGLCTEALSSQGHLHRGQQLCVYDVMALEPNIAVLVYAQENDILKTLQQLT